MLNKLAKATSVAVVAAAGAFVGMTASTILHDSTIHAATKAPAAVQTSTPVVVGMDTFRNVAREATNAVVNITTTKLVHPAQMQLPFEMPFGMPFGVPMHPRSEKETETAAGSGFIINANGTILTNRHVVNGADKVTVSLADGTHYTAKVLGEDARTDVAVVKIEPTEKLTVLPLGDSNKAQVGEWVMAVGNPFGMGGNSVTVGVVSFKGRDMDISEHGTPIEMLQTDAAINPGNSGGPLINAQGQAIGINTLIISPGASQSSGVGFAVPIDVAKQELGQLESKGHVDRGWLGVEIQAVDQDLAKSLKLDKARGAIVADVTADSPAAAAGLKPGDVVVDVDGHAIKDSADLSGIVSSKAPGTNIKLGIIRDGQQRAMTVKLGRFPDHRADLTGGSESQGRLGMQIQPLTPDLARSLGLAADTKGLAVANVEAGSRAEDAGLRAGDVILSVNGTPVSDVPAFKADIARSESAGLARLRVEHQGMGARFLVIKLG